MSLTKTFLIFRVLLLFSVIFEISGNNKNDGFNMYKDLLRGKTEGDELGEIIGRDGLISKIVYFYRTPILPFSDVSLTESKRTVNKFKNMMLNKDNLETLSSDEEIPKDILSKFYIPRIMSKRSPGAILSWANKLSDRARLMNNYRIAESNIRPAA